MVRALLFIVMFAFVVSARTLSQAPPEKFKKDVTPVERAITDAVNAIVPGTGLFQTAKGTYLEGYGAVFVLQTMLEPPRNPFTGNKSPAEVRASIAQRKTEIQNRLTSLLRDRVGAMESLSPAESVSIILYLINSNPADTPDLPSQIVFTVKKQDATSIKVREY